MRSFKYIIALLCAFLCGGIAALDKLAIAEPVGTGGVSKDDLKVLWSTLESSVSSSQYELITRGSLQSMLTEIGLTDSSGLVNLNSAQKAKIGQLKTVNCILVSNLGKSGTRYNLSLMVMDASTGSINDKQKTSITFNTMAELSDKLKSVLREIGIGPAIKQYGRIAMLAPDSTVTGIPVSLSAKLNSDLEGNLINNGVKLQNLKEVNRILNANGIKNLAETEPALYARVGELLQVDQLIRITITRYSLRTQKKYIEVTKREAVRHLGDLGGTVRIISAQTGDLIGSFSFKTTVDFSDIDDDTTDWTVDDYCDYLVNATVPGITKQLIPVLKKPE